jgi:ferric-dicitrate binding protein FerR (iron transport regulator)
MTEKQSIEDMLPAFLAGELDAEGQQIIEAWKLENNENLQIFTETQQVWEKTMLLRRMQKYDGQKALEKVNKKIKFKSTGRYLRFFQKVAAILVLPLLVATLYFSTKKPAEMYADNSWYTLKTGAGMRSEFVLPDGTKVFLNSNTTLKYPIGFNGTFREVDLKGEAYFEVAKDLKHPFIVNTGNVNIEVTGTEFKASNYENEALTEIVLVEGSVKLFQGSYSGEKKMFKTLVPGEKAIYIEEERKLCFERVDTEKYIAWKDGRLLFRDDSMDEVVRRLNRWYNVDIQLTGHDLGDYVYTATFEEESLIQVLDLLKMSAPIDYEIKNRKRKNNNTFSKMKIEIHQN